MEGDAIQRKKKSRKSHGSSSSANNKFSDEQKRKLCQMVQERLAIWSLVDPLYRNRDAKSAAWREIGLEIGMSDVSSSLRSTLGAGLKMAKPNEGATDASFVEIPQTPKLVLFPKVEKVVSKVLTPLGFEVFPFHIGWYNELVGPRFYLDFPQNTVALVVLSGPDAFEKSVIPYLKSQLRASSEYCTVDPLDASMKHTFSEITRELELIGYSVEPIQDFDLHPSRKPKVLVQTAAHVAGAVEYFHRDRMKTKGSTWLKDSKLFGVAIHPDHGGWFAIRGVLILKNLVLDSDQAMIKPERPFGITDESKIALLLEEFGLHWRNHTWRDVLPRKSSVEYSQDFKDYLATAPGERWEFMKSRGLLNQLQKEN